MAGVKDALPPPRKCDNCNSPKVRLRTHKRGNYYICNKCHARVYCHTGTRIPLGYMATGNVRHKRIIAHKAFDPLWREHLISRDKAYAWMERQLGVEAQDAHIGRLTEQQLDQITHKARRYYRKLKARVNKRKAVEDATNRRHRDTTYRRRKTGGKWKPK